MVEIPRHHSTEATARDRGAGLGRAQAERIGQMCEVYDRLFETAAGLGPADVRGHGGQAMEVIAGWAPELADEIEGIAAGSGIDVERVAALNARTELLAAARGRGECSTIACLGTITADGEPIGIQTWDWHEEVAGCWMHWTIDHPDGRRVETMTEAGIVGKVGMSSDGVGVLLNILGHRLDGPPVGVPVHVICRRVLDEADNAVRALELVAAAEVSASSAVTIVADDEDGGACCTVELSPAGPGFVTPDDRGVLLHTNHFLAEPGRPGDSMVRLGPDSVLRLDHARRGTARLETGAIDEDAILSVMRSHRGGSGAICCHPAEGAPFGERWRTLATVTVRPAQRELTLRRGGPCGQAWSTDAPAMQSLSRQGIPTS